MGTGRNRLTARTVLNAKISGDLLDGGGLRLQVSKAGNKSWILRYMRNGRSREMGLGSFPAVTLERARSKAEDCRKLLNDGKDPIEERKAQEAAIAATSATAKTFDQCSALCIAAKRPGWRNPKHADQWTNTLKTYASPYIGKMDVATIETQHVLRVLEPIWVTKTETASRVRGRIEAVLDWARVMGYRSGENPARWRGHFSEILPNRSKVARVTHHPALPYGDLGAFMIKLRQSVSMSAKALELVILTAARVSEVANAAPDEFDLTTKVWTVPAKRMKAGRHHRVPLSDEAMRLIKDQMAHATSDCLFPGLRRKSSDSDGLDKGRPLTSEAVLKLLRDMGYNTITVHGFRSTFRDWAAERTNYPREVAEAALAHILGDKTEASYQRGDMLDKRARMMDDWAAFCSRVEPKGVVVSIKKSKRG